MSVARVAAVAALLALPLSARAGILETEAACDAGDAKACAQAGAQNLTTGAFDAAQARLVKACNEGAGCRLHLVGQHLHDVGKPAEAMAIYTLGCDKGDVGSCTRLYSMLMIGDGVPVDQPRAIALLTKLCEGESPYLCEELARHHRTGDGVPVDQARARALMRRAEEAEERSIAQYKQIRDQYPQHVENEARDCAAGKAYACASMATHHAWVTRDVEQAVRYTEEACRLAPETCHWRPVAKLLGQLGQGPRALTYLSAACDAKMGHGCRDLALFLLKGEHAQQDLPKAARLALAGCDAGRVSECEVAAWVRSEQHDAKGARALFLKAAAMRRSEAVGKNASFAEAAARDLDQRAQEAEAKRKQEAIAPYLAILNDLREESEALHASRRNLDRLSSSALDEMQSLEHNARGARAAQGTSDEDLNNAAAWVARRSARQEAIRSLLRQLRTTP